MLLRIVIMTYMGKSKQNDKHNSSDDEGEVQWETNSRLPFEAELIPSCRTELHSCQTHSWQVVQSVGAIIDPINKVAKRQIWDIA